MTIEEGLHAIEEQVHMMVAMATKVLRSLRAIEEQAIEERLGRKSQAEKEGQTMAGAPEEELDTDIDWGLRWD